MSTFVYRAEEPRDNRPIVKKAKVNTLAFLTVIDIASSIKTKENDTVQINTSVEKL